MEELNPHQERLLKDFLARSRGMSTLNLAAGIVGALAALLISAPQPVVALLAILGGALIGVSLEKRYLAEMRGVIEVLATRSAAHGAALEQRSLE